MFSLHYHLVMVECRRRVVTDEMPQRLARIFESIAQSYGVTLLEWNHDGDHVHVLLKAEPSCPLPKFMNAYKSASSRLIKKKSARFARNCGRSTFGQSPAALSVQAARRWKSCGSTSKIRERNEVTPIVSIESGSLTVQKKRELPRDASAVMNVAEDSSRL